MKANRKQYKKIALALSLCAIVIWGLLGAGASIAWFADTSDEVTNIINTAQFDLVVSKRLENGTYSEVNATTKVFDETVLYEPGYVQIAILKIENNGTVPFDFQTAVTVDGYTTATNAFGGTMYLQEHLRFGVVTSTDEADLLQKLNDREKAVAAATEPLGVYHSDPAELGAHEAMYMALIVRMASTVGNEANYRGDNVPTVELGISVRATQKTN